MTIRTSHFAVALLFCIGASAQTTSYTVTNLVTSAKDKQLINPWGISRPANSTKADAQWWVSDQGTGLSTLYNARGTKTPLVVTVPPAAGGTIGSPTGTTQLNGNFYFATLDGTLSQWLANQAPAKPGAGCAECHVTSATLKVDHSAMKASYQGMTEATNGGVPTFYVANANGGVETYDTSFNQIALTTGAFTDAKIPSTYAPAGIQAIGSRIYVTYNRKAGGGAGYVDAFDTAGTLKLRLQNGSFDQPWGVAQAPKTFGQFSGMVLVGNTGSGWIGAYDPKTGKFAGFLVDSATGYDVTIANLWAIAFGGGNADNGKTNVLYFNGGGARQKTGFFGTVAVTAAE